MENLGIKFTETEQRYFGELFAAYDVDGQEKVSGPKASELLLATQLPTEVLQQITELCGAKRVGHFGRMQFYLALKLIGAAQAGIPLKPEVLSSGVEIPFPKLHKPSEPGPLPPPPVSNKNKAPRQPSLKDLQCSPSHQPYVQSDGGRSAQVANSRGSSPEAGETASTTVATSPKERRWTTFSSTADGRLNWSQFEEHRRLLGNGEDSSERHSSDDEHDVWSIADDQREYYTKQFQTMQPDLKGKIGGTIAKEFFEKSKLPVPVLSKIWQLSDIDKDGALTLEEFCTAMHLVVLRRNNIGIPDALPPALIPSITMLQKTVEGQEVRSGYQVKGAPAPTASAPPAPVQQTTNRASPRGMSSPPAPQTKEPLSPQNKEWTRFNDSPTSGVSSPNMKPVNFDFSSASVEQNPRILHPVARRLSPEGHTVPYTNDVDKTVASNDAAGDFKVIPKNGSKKVSAPAALQQSLAYALTTDAPGEAANSYSGGISQSQVGGLKKEPPPPPPPRPKRNHARSSSLDLNRLDYQYRMTGRSSSQNLGAPPAVPPRASPGSHMSKSITGEDMSFTTDFADFDHFAESRNEVPLTSAQPRQFEVGAFEPYKKPTSMEEITRLSSDSSYSEDEEDSPAPTDDSAVLLVDEEEDKEDKEKHRTVLPLAVAAAEIKTIPSEKWELAQAVRAHRERNNMLTLLNSELNQELAEATEERIALEIQLENLKPFSC